MERIRWLPRPLLISLRNTFRRKGRLALTLFTLTLGGAIFIAVFNVRVGLNDYVDQLGKYFLADVNLSFERAYRLEEVEEYALSVPGVKAIEGWAFASAEWQDENGQAIDNIQILAPPADSALVDPMLIEGRWIHPGDENAITINEAILADYPDVHMGDHLTLDIGNKQTDWVLVGVFKFVGTDSLMAYTSYEYLTEVLNQSGKAFTYRLVSDDHSMRAQEQLSQVLDTFFRDQGFRVSDVSAGLSSLETASEGLGVLITFLLIMALLTALVGSIGLMGTMSMNVMERTREIGVMRAIGAVDRVIMNTVIVEGMIIGSLSWVLGAALSFPISALLSNIISRAIFNTPMEFSFTILGFVIWIFFVLLLSTLASIVPAYNAARLTIREVLAYE
jgi:putative ABC transport system permease protein